MAQVSHITDCEAEGIISGLADDEKRMLIAFIESLIKEGPQ